MQQTENENYDNISENIPSVAMGINVLLDILSKDSQSDGSHWILFYQSQSTIVSVNNFLYYST